MSDGSKTVVKELKTNLMIDENIRDVLVALIEARKEETLSGQKVMKECLDVVASGIAAIALSIQESEKSSAAARAAEHSETLAWEKEKFKMEFELKKDEIKAEREMQKSRGLKGM